MMKFSKITVFWRSAIQLPRALARGREIKKIWALALFSNLCQG
jgi:hypothetical protein